MTDDTTLNASQKKKIINDAPLEEVESNCKKNLIKIRDFKKYLGQIYRDNPIRFEQITKILKNNYQDFSKISFDKLYYDALIINPVNYYHLIKLDYKVDFDSLLFNTLKSINHHLVLSIGQPKCLFKVLDDVVENYVVHKKKNKIITNIEQFPSNTTNKQIEYKIIKDIYLKQKPQNPLKLDRLWIHSLVIDIHMDNSWHPSADITKHKKYVELKELIKQSQINNNTELTEILNTKYYPWIANVVTEVEKEILKEKLALELTENLEKNLNKDQCLKPKAKI